MFEFTQDDLDNFRVLFRHEGDEYGKVGLWITDGQFYANGVLEVRASAPFVAVVNNTGLLVQRGGVAVFSATNLSVETNLNLWGEQLEFEVTEDPRHGHLQLQRDASGFTQLDLEKGHLAYHHDNSTALNDHFR
jgi:chondroitin sulfate proteoglycan 4